MDPLLAFDTTTAMWAFGLIAVVLIFFMMQN